MVYGVYRLLIHVYEALISLGFYLAYGISLYIAA